MIDNSKQVAALMLKLKTHLPIPAKPTDILIRQLGTKSLNISPDSQIELTVRSIFIEVHEIVAKYFYLPPWKHQYT